MSTLRLGFGAPPRLPSLEGFPDLLDGRWLNGRRLRPFDAAPALDRAEGGLLRRVEHLLMTSQCSEYGFFVVREEPSAMGPATLPDSHFTPTTGRRLGPWVYVLISIACPSPNPSLRK